MKNYYILKSLCRIMYLTGAGDFWYEEGKIGDDKHFLYIFYGVTLFSIYILLTVMEVLAAIWGDFPNDEKSDSVTLAVCHVVVMTKIFLVLANRKLVKKLNSEMVQICKDYEDEDRVANNYRIMKMNVGAYVFTVYVSCTGYLIEGIRKKLTGSHFITLVTYWPSYEDDSITAVSARIFATIVFWLLMATMVSIDAIVLVTLIVYKYKLVTLRYYFEGLRAQFDINNHKGNEKYASDQLYAGLIEGVLMHGNLLRISKDIDRSYGPVLAYQVLLSFGSAVSLLLQLALSKDLSFATGVKILFFIIALFLLLGLCLCNAGEITYQASLLSDSVFYCGWHATPMRKDLRQLILLACASAQRPIVMKAFKMLELTYGTFIQVLRCTYSVFALFYAHNK